MNYMLKDAVNILVSESSSNYGYDYMKTELILEDANSPITRKYQEKLFQSVIEKGHIDFGAIPKSEGNIKKYDGYITMLETLDAIENVGIEFKNKDVLTIVKTIRDAIKYIESLSSSYSKGFDTKCEYVMLEYNTYVYTVVEATTSILYEYIDYVKRPDNGMFKIVLKNTKLRANLFYVEQLEKFNRLNEKNGINYRKMLDTMCVKDRENFLGTTALGVAAVSLVALSVVPITRELIYQLYHLRGKLAHSFELQASFLEMNKACVESNEAFTADKRKKIIEKQNKMRMKLIKLADMLRIKEVKSKVNSKRDLENNNKLLTVSHIQDDVSNSPMELI